MSETISSKSLPPRLAERKPFKFDRRNFIASSVGGFMLTFALDGGANQAEAQSGAANTTLSPYIQVGSDNTVTISFGGCELGQGAMTGLAQCAAEDLMVNWSQVKIVQAPTGAISFATGGSSSIRGHAMAWRTAGAAARDMLIAAAAQIWNVSPSLCSAPGGGTISGPGGQTMTYAAAASTAATMPVPSAPALVPSSAFRLIGQPIPRYDIPLKVNGSAVFGIDVFFPGMLFAAVQHCPVIGGTLKGTPTTPSGAIAVVPLRASDTRGGVIANSINAVAVVASNTYAAMQGARSFASSKWWNIPASAAGISTSAYATQMQTLMGATSGVYTAESGGNVNSAIASAAHMVDASYSLPYCAHATLEPLSCTASYDGKSLQVWAPTQFAAFAVGYAAAASGLPPSQITVNTTFLGGGLGRKFENDFVSQAVQVAVALKTTVKLTWPRGEDFGHDQYRPMALVRMRGGVDSSGNVTAFWARNVSQSILAQHNFPVDTQKGDSQATEGTTGLRYNFGSRLAEWVPFPGSVPVGFWRSVGASINGFAVESFIDELAFAAGIDPFVFRQQLLASDPRASALMQAADTASSWRKSLPAGHAYGVAFVESFNTLVCEVVDVSQATQTVSGVATPYAKINRVAVVVDPGFAVNPNQVEAQMQGGVVHGLGAALWSSVPFTGGQAGVSNYSNYRLVKGGDMPQVTVTVINSDQTGNPSGGIGEPGVPPIAPAVANAWFRLTGQRLRSLPMFPTLSRMSDG